VSGRQDGSAPLSQRLLAPLEAGGIRFDLDSFRQLLHRVGDPHLRQPSVLVAGTNGKGSTSALVASVAHAAGYRVGLYTSPHLESARERVRVGGIAVDDETLAAALERVIDAAGASSIAHAPTHFEALTGAAFLVLADAGVDLAVFEVGLGGRLDATNVTEPLVSAVTSIGLDHQEYLGETLTEIAFEKAGVFRRGRVALWGKLPDEARTRIEVVAAERGALRDEETGDWSIDGVEVDELAQRFAIVDGTGARLARPTLRLAGAHQRDNALLAARIVDVLRRSGWSRLDRAAVESGFASCQWPGRLEEVALPGSAGRRAVLFDGAHNEDGSRALARHLERRRQPFDVLLGALGDKRPEKWLSLLARGAERVWATTVPSPRALAAGDIVRLLGADGVAAHAVATPDAALDAALAGSTNDLVVAGSLYLVGELRRALRARAQVPAPADEIALFSVADGVSVL
jgi:dihydrofolate synthase/folylpolyglutamate synthase